MTRPWRIPSGAVMDAGPYAGRNKWPLPSTPAEGGDRGHGHWPGVAPSADGAMDDWGFRAVRSAGVSPVATGGCFAGCGQRVFRPLRRATSGAASGLRDLGCPPPVGKSGRRGILRQGKVWFRSHTGCMARSRTAAMAEKARRAPQTHGWWAALIRKKSSKTFIFFTAILRQVRFI